MPAANLGFPRIGAKRALKKAVEAYWKGTLAAEELLQEGKRLRAAHWTLQRDAGLDSIPSNDFSFYDQMLDMIATLGAVPPRFGAAGKTVTLDQYFAMARGNATAPAMEMTKWFDTNYHYIVPELHKGQQFRLSSTKAVDEYREAKALGIETRPVLIGPVTFLALAKARDDGFDPLDALGAILPVYQQLLAALRQAGATAVQLDEPILATDLDARQKQAFATSYGALAASGPAILLANYFGGYGANLDVALALPVAGLHFDLVRAPEELDAAIEGIGDRQLSLGLVDGRNVWRADLGAALRRAEKAVAALGADRVAIAPSCSLLHAPLDLAAETALDPELRSWLAFAVQKLDEVKLLARAAAGDRGADLAAALAENAGALASRQASTRTHDAAVRARIAGITAADSKRAAPYAVRRKAQQQQLPLPRFPTTTIGSFPQTAAVRHARAEHRRGALSDADYQKFLEDETRACIRKQEELGLDMLVHGEFERNDMVEYFGEKLQGFAFTRAGWVQSYGSRCVKPPLIFGDVARPAPMTVAWARFAQSQSQKPVKGMLTGPVTILQWSFVRDDQPRAETCRQIALAIRDEVADLEAAGLRAIQIDEPAVREGLPLRRKDWDAYLEWAVECFRLSSSVAKNETQIHSHMCYSEFNDILPAIAAMDADVLSIEASRSDMELLLAFGDFSYPNEIGPGVWDIHSPRVPSVAEMETLLRKAASVIPADRLWVNPDCGLKTRGWPETEAALKNLVQAARHLREGKPEPIAVTKGGAPKAHGHAHGHSGHQH